MKQIDNVYLPSLSVGPKTRNEPPMMTARRLLIYPGGRKGNEREGGKEKNENPRGFLPLPQERDTLVVVEGGHGTFNIGYVQ